VGEPSGVCLSAAVCFLYRSDVLSLDLAIASLPSIDLPLRVPPYCPHGITAAAAAAAGIRAGSVERIWSECICCALCIICSLSAVVELTLLELSMMELCLRRPRAIVLLRTLSSPLSEEPVDVLDVLGRRMPNRLSEPPVHSVDLLLSSVALVGSTGRLPSNGRLSSGRNMKLG